VFFVIASTTHLTPFGPVSEPSPSASGPSWADGIVIGESRAIREAIALARQVGGSRSTTVLITGETGTGKELFARGVHASSPSASEPFVAINCAAIPETLLESELFGHEKDASLDARTQKQGLLEVAGRGTLFLDEIGDLASALQPKLLRVLEQRTFRRIGGSEELPILARIITGTNATLEDAVDHGQFRADLFYRLNVVRLDLPPLRERGNDVELIARHYLAQHARAQGVMPLQLAADAIDALNAHSWPGNVRELKNVMERAVLVCTGTTIQRRHLAFQRRRLVQETSTSASVIHIPPDGKSLETITREAIHMTLLLTQGNLSAAARILGISRPTLARKMREAGLVRRSILAAS
jgi:two-component system NtrC family response regulator